VPSYPAPPSPFDLLRSNLRPRDPRTIQAAEDPALPLAYLPQRMMFSRWKTPPGVKPAWGSNAIGALTALETVHALRLAIAATASSSAPQMSSPASSAADMGATRLPQPSDNADPNINKVPVARGVLSDSQVVSAQELNQYVQQTNATLSNAKEEADARKIRALQEVGAMQSNILSMLAGPPGR